MYKATLITSIALAVLLVATAAPAQNPLSGTLTTAFGDVPALKRKAEAGDAGAQVALGEALVSHFRASEALEWYRKAAVQGSVSGQYHVGHMLLFGGPGIPHEFAVKPNHAQGIRWTFMAATNHHAQACHDMASALLEGYGTPKNQIEGYAWLKLYAGMPAGSALGRGELNQLALKMDTDALGRAEALAAEFKAGKWRAPAVRVVPEGEPRLKLSGITFGGKVSLAVINGRTLSEGESARVSVGPANVGIKCLRIEKDAVSVSVEGEDTPRVLRLR
jgi:hypothetical protein